jgi:hypothetical protein
VIQSVVRLQKISVARLVERISDFYRIGQIGTVFTNLATELYSQTYGSSLSIYNCVKISYHSQAWYIPLQSYRFRRRKRRNWFASKKGKLKHTFSNGTSCSVVVLQTGRPRVRDPMGRIRGFFFLFFTIYSRYLKRVISKRDECEYLKQVPSIDGSLELI